MSTTPAAASIPPVRSWRKRFRAARREHHHRTVRDTLTDLYTAFWFVLIYGGALYSEVDRHLSTPGAREGAIERHWLVVALLLALAGLVWRGLRMVGPMTATPAERFWAVSAPLPRGRWLAGRFAGLVVAGAGLGAAAAVAVLVLGIREGSAAAAALAGALYGTAATAGAVVFQGTASRRWGRTLEAVLLGGAAVMALAVIVAHHGQWPIPVPGRGIGAVLLGAGAPLAGLAVWRGAATLAGLDRGRLGAGAEVAAAAVTAAVWMDATVLGRVLEVRRWRRVGRVRSRRPAGRIPGVPARGWALVQAELLRTARRPAAPAVWMALVLAQHGMAVAAPSLAGVSRVILAYAVAGRFMAGLRTLARSDGLRRALGGSEHVLRLAHVVVPGVAALLWWAATVPTDPIEPGLMLGLAAVSVAAAYRAATRGPIDYEAGITETPFGPVPIGLVVQLGRGPDLLGAAIVLRVLIG